MTTCTSSSASFYLSISLPPLFCSPIRSRSLTHAIHTQLPKRDPRTAAGAHPPRPARYARPRRAFRHRADLRRDLDLDARHHGHVPGRLFWHPHGLSRRGLPVQRAPGSDVCWEHDVLCRDGFVVRDVSCFALREGTTRLVMGD